MAPIRPENRDGYHSVACLKDCEWCPDCPCHDDGGTWDDEPLSTGEFDVTPGGCGKPVVVSDASGLMEDGAEKGCHPNSAPDPADSPERLQ